MFAAEPEKTVTPHQHGAGTRLLLLTHFFLFCFVCFAGVKVAYSVVVIRSLLLFLGPKDQSAAGCMLTSRLLLFVVDNDTRHRVLNAPLLTQRASKH